MNKYNMAVPRVEKALELLNDITVLSDAKAVYSNDDKIYHIDYVEETCECPDHVYREVKCKHIWAVQIKTKKYKIINTQ
jgi:hypothetical protein